MPNSDECPSKVSDEREQCNKLLDVVENNAPYCDVRFADQNTSTMVDGVKVYTSASLVARARYESMGRKLLSNVTWIPDEHST